MNKSLTWFSLPKVIFILLLACVSVALWVQIPGMQEDLLCCVLHPAFPDQSYHSVSTSSTGLWFGLLAFGTLTTLYRVLRSQNALRFVLASRKKQLRQGIHHRLPSIDSLKNTLVIDTEEPFVFCFGFFRPQICISTGLLKKLSFRELKATLLHEAHHCRSFDPLRLLVITMIADFLFFLPVVAEWKKNYESELELKADRFAIQHAGRSALAAALQRFAGFPSSAMGSNAIVSGFGSSSARIAEILGEAQIRRQVSLRSLVASSASTVIICALL